MANSIVQSVVGSLSTGTPVTLTSWTPGEGELLLVGIACRTVGLTPSVAGNGQTWIQSDISPVTNTDSECELHVFYVAAASAPTTGSITVTVTGNLKPVVCIAVRIAGAVTTAAALFAAEEKGAGPAGSNNDMKITLASTVPHCFGVAYGSHRATTLTVPSDEVTILANQGVAAGADTTSLSCWYLPMPVPVTGEVGADNDISGATDWCVWAAAIPAVGGANNALMMMGSGI